MVESVVLNTSTFGASNNHTTIYTMLNSNFITRLGIGLLFVWGGLEKFFEGFLGGVGLDAVGGLLYSSGLSFLGEPGTFVLGAVLAALELVAGLAVLFNRQLVLAYGILAFFMLNALLLVWVPAGDWMNIFIHLALFTTLVGLALAAYKENGLTILGRSIGRPLAK
jgi:putative oxidoreductase